MAKRENMRRRRRRRAIIRNRIILAVLIVVLIALCATLIYVLRNRGNDSSEEPVTTEAVSDGQGETGDENGETNPAEEPTTGVSTTTPVEELPDTFETEPDWGEPTVASTGNTVLDEANRLAAMYDYDAAIELLQGQADYSSNQDYADAVSNYETQKSQLVKWADNTQITHVFFHSLVVDPTAAFSSYKADEYNEVMTTIDEFCKMIQSMYDRGYVLVRMHDIAEIQVQEDGTEKMVQKEIMLPPGKIPFVLSVDDVSYYEYMENTGFASRLVIGGDGMVTNEMDLYDENGNVTGTVTGSFDVLPILEDFIKVHPDFSYKGAKGIIALTGYNGILGYRTSDVSYGPGNTTYPEAHLWDNPNIEQDKQTARTIAEAIKNQGWEFASHSWGHPDLQTIPEERFIRDTDWWEAEVEPLIGETDIMIYPKGADIGSWRPYDDPEQLAVTPSRFAKLKEVGFDYFCNVDGSQKAWVQFGTDYMRQGRRNLDGTRLWEAVNGGTDRVSDLFDAKSVIDPLRPEPKTE
ncbi:MAG: polysaccharide deacetylase family protein [Lachnospiraceae bacterium]